MKSAKEFAALGTVLTVLGLLTWWFHWPWETPVSFVCILLILLALNFGRSKLVKALTPKHPLAAKVGPELLLIGLAIWAIKARICGEKSNLWMEICTAVIFVWVVWKVLTHFRDRQAVDLQQTEEQAHSEGHN